MIKDSMERIKFMHSRSGYPKKAADCETVQELAHTFKFTQYVDSCFLMIAGLFGSLAFFGFTIFGAVFCMIFILNVIFSFLSLRNYEKEMKK